MSHSIRELEVGPWQLQVREVRAAAVERALEARGLVGAETLEQLALMPAQRSGRSETWLLPLEDGSRVHLRPFTHGGALARLTGRRFATPNRFREELLAHSRLFDRDLALPEPFFAIWRRRGRFYEGAFATGFIEEAEDALALLDREPGDSELDAFTRAAARTIKRFHDAGARHADLHLKNVLVRREPDERTEPDCWLLDLDQARLCESVEPRRRMRELMRLARSVRKRGHGKRLTPRRQRLFLDAYCEGDTALGRSLMSYRRREQFRTELHALFHPRVAR